MAFSRARTFRLGLLLGVLAFPGLPPRAFVTPRCGDVRARDRVVEILEDQGAARGPWISTLGPRHVRLLCRRGGLRGGEGKRGKLMEKARGAWDVSCLSGWLDWEL